MLTGLLKENSVFLKPRPYFWHEIRLSTHREQFGEGRRPLRAIKNTRDRHISILRSEWGSYGAASK